MSDWYYYFAMVLIILGGIARIFGSSTDDSTPGNSEYMRARSAGNGVDLGRLRDLAREGHASSLASFTWECLSKGAHARAISAYDETRHALTHCAGGQSMMAWELANVDSNHALNLLGSGKELADVGHLWTRNQSAGHAETQVYAMIYRVKCEGASPKSLNNIPLAVRKEVLETLEIGARKANGWYRKWCTELLSEYRQVLSGQ